MTAKMKSKIEEISEVFEMWYRLAEMQAENGRKHEKTYDEAIHALDKVIVSLAEELVTMYNNENHS